MFTVLKSIALSVALVGGGFPTLFQDTESFRSSQAFHSIRSSMKSVSIAGATCKKTGQIRTTSKGVFRCSAVGNSKIWRRTSSNSTRSIPTTSSSSALTSTTSSTIPPPRRAVYDDIVKRAALARTRPSAAVFEFKFSPSIGASRATQLRQAVLWAFLPWEDRTNGASTRVVVIDENGLEFWKANLPAGGGNCPSTPRVLSRNGVDGFGCWNDDGDRVLLLVIGSDVKEWPSNFLHHEVTHLAQAAIYRSKARIVDEPCFLSEGEATLYGFVLGDGVSGGEVAHKIGRDLAKEIAAENNFQNDADWLSFLRLREPRDQTCALKNFNYFVGHLYMERLYLDFGVDRIADWKSQLSGQDWRLSFKRVFGLSPSDWYSTSLIPYIRESCAC